MKFEDAKINMWIRYEHANARIYQMTETSCTIKVQKTHVEFVTLSPDEFENKDIHIIEPPTFSLHDNCLYMGKYTSLKNKIVKIIQIDNELTMFPYRIMVADTDTWANPFELQKIAY